MLPPRKTHDTSNCSVARTLGVVGEKWTFLILREASHGVTRFEDMYEILGCPRNLLSRRLRTLTGEGVMEARPYQEPGSRRRTEYVLTDKGWELMPALIAILEWGDRHLADPEGPPILVEHADCGGSVYSQLTCSEGHVVEHPSDISFSSGPSFRVKPQAS